MIDIMPFINKAISMKRDSYSDTIQNMISYFKSIDKGHVVTGKPKSTEIWIDYYINKEPFARQYSVFPLCFVIEDSFDIFQQYSNDIVFVKCKGFEDDIFSISLNELKKINEIEYYSCPAFNPMSFSVNAFVFITFC